MGAVCKPKRRQREAASVITEDTHLMRRRLQWYGHVSTQQVLSMTVEWEWLRGRPRLRFMDTMRRYKSEWNGEGWGSRGVAQTLQSDSKGFPLRIWPAKVSQSVCNNSANTVIII